MEFSYNYMAEMKYTNGDIMINSTKLIQPLRIYIGAEVKTACLAIWPCETWPEDTDTKIYLKLNLVSNQIKHFVLDTYPDGETPRFTENEYVPSYSYSQIGQRIKAWRPGDDYDLPEFYDYEVFDLRGSAEYGWLIGCRLIGIELVCFEDFSNLAGILLHFDSNRTIWSTPGTDGNTIGLEFDRRYLPDEWRFIKIRLDLDCRSVNDCETDRLVSI
jgi:hypothetical protein